MNIKTLSVSAIITATLISAAFSDTATIDLEKIVRLHPNTTTDKAALEQKLKDYEAEALALENQAISAMNAFNEVAKQVQDRAAMAAMSDKKKTELEADAKVKYEVARDLQAKAVEKKRELQQDLTKQEVQLLQRTIKDIEQNVASYAKAHDIEMVLPMTGAKLGITPAVLWADPKLDITEAIMKQMNITEPAAEAVPAK